jgi:hypothetical protein
VNALPSSYLPTASGVNFVQKSGDTMTGNLTVPAVRASSASGLPILNQSGQQVAVFGSGLGIGTNLYGTLDMTSHYILNVLDPVTPQGVATANYVDSQTTFCPAARVGDYVSNAFTSLAQTVQQTTGGVVRAFPFVNFSEFTTNEIRIIASTGGSAGFRYKIGIFTDSGNYPASGIIITPELDGNLNTVRTTAISPAVTIPKGLNWVVYTASGLGTQVTHRAVAVGGLINALGYNPALGNNQQYTGYTVNRTYDGTMPALYPAGATFIVATNAPLVVMRRSA